MVSMAKRFPLMAAGILGVSVAFSNLSYAACTQTLSPGADLGAAISNAPSGSTICLNQGIYAEASLFGVSKTSDVTLQSISSRTATVSFIIKNSNHLRFQDLTIAKLDMRNGSVFNQNITVANNTFIGQMLVDGSGEAGVNVNIVVDNNRFDGINICERCYTGRLQLWAITGVKITNNHFGGGGTADGILWGGFGGAVGPGNVFEDILQSNAGTTGAHIDNIQLVGGQGFVKSASIIGNYFRNGDTFIMAPDQSWDITVKDNVFDGRTTTYPYKIQFGSAKNILFEHNTLINAGATFDSKPVLPASENAIVRNNIITDIRFKTEGGNGCTNCTFTRNLFGPNSIPNGTNNLLGLATFVGSPNPMTWGAWQLTSTSLGYKAATDGTDVGSTYFGSGTITPPSPIVLQAPKNLRIVL